jgi:hypothetical protein
MATERPNRRALVLLSVGATVGILLGIISVFHRSKAAVSALPDDAIALVNGTPIREEAYVSAVALLAGDKRTEVTEEDRAFVLDRLIEEELLIQRGIEIGLVDSDRAIRKAITQAMLAVVVAESVSEQPSKDDLRTFYEKNPSLFGRSISGTDVQVVADGQVPQPPAFAEMREQVEAVYLRHSRDDALRVYLEWLRDEAKIALAPEVSR